MAEEVIEETPEENPEETLEEPTQDEVEEAETEEAPEEVPEEPEEAPEPIDPDKIEIQTRNIDEDPVDYGEDIDPDDAKTIGSIVEKQTASVKAKLQDTQDRLEVDQYVAQNPQFDRYKPVILKYMKHPAYSRIPVKNIAAMVAADELVSMGAKAEREAQIKADSTKTKGSTARTPVGAKADWKKASKDAFEAQRRKVMGMDV